MIGAVLIFSNRGELIVSKLYKATLKRSVADVFRVQVINNQDIRSPILTLGSTTFHSIRSTSKDHLWLVTVSRNNCNSAAIWEFLYKLNDAMTIYGINSELTLMEDFMVCYELLSVMLMPGGIPIETDLMSVINMMSTKPKEPLQSTNLYSNDNNNKYYESNKLKSINNILTSNGGDTVLRTNLPSPTNAIPNLLRRASSISPISTSKDFMIKKNELILNVIEKINILVSKDGFILKSYVDGVIESDNRMHERPVCQIILNDLESMRRYSRNSKIGDRIIEMNSTVKSDDKVILQDYKFHQCVSFDKFDEQRIIQFITPEGKTELMKYHIANNLQIPFKVTPVVSKKFTGSMDYHITLKSLFPAKLSAKNLLLRIPVPPGTIDCKISVSNGNCNFVPEENAIIWKFNKYNGLTEDKLSAVTVCSNDTTELTSQQWQRPPISLQFNILMFSNSDLKIRQFNIIDKNKSHRITKWIKYVSQSGSYEIRY